MNKTAIKNYAIWARVQLIEAAKHRAFEYEITDGGENRPNVETVGGRPLSADEKSQRKELIGKIRQKGYAQVMEEAAYTWFNRFIALRYMEVNGYLPSKIRVFTDESNAFKPEILKEAMNVELDRIDRSRVLELLDKQDNEALYKYLLITQCNSLNTGLPYMFEKIANWTELLFPANLLRSDSVLGRMISMIPEEDWKDQVQIIGWLYQYYNAEPKDKVFADLKKNIKISKENIPAATQLFTPDWIVRYMVENSLGRLWVEGHPGDELKANWKYYLEEAEQEPEVQAQLAEIRKEYAALKPEEIKVIDPCMGSGHILVYMFDVLVQIYESYGYNTRDAAGLILQNNLYGLDIDDRAAQLAYFAVMMKARQYDRRIFSRGIQPHVYAIVESNGISREAIDCFESGSEELTEALETILAELTDAKEYGSILNVTQVDFAALYARLQVLDEEGSLFAEQAQHELLPLIEVAEALAQKYHAVVTNPPYMGASNMNGRLNEFIKTNYADYKSDFFSAFVIRASQMTREEGYCGFFTPYVWMFIQSYEKMREYLYKNATIETLIQFEYSAFEEATVPVCSFAFKNSPIHGKKGCYFRLTDFRGGMEVQRQKTLEAIANHHCGFYFEQSSDNFSKIPGSPVAYWVSEAIFKIFEDGYTIGSKYKTITGSSTGENARFLRLWHEVNNNKIGYSLTSTYDGYGYKWIPCNKGGAFRKWYGNQDFVINWENDGEELKAFATYKNHGKHWSRFLKSLDMFYHVGITWSKITSGDFSTRFMPEGFIMESAANAIMPQREDMNVILGLMNTKIVQSVLKIKNPTLNMQAGDIVAVPIIDTGDNRREIERVVSDNIEISKIDWDSFETSWDFKRHPLVAIIPEGGSFLEVGNIDLAECYMLWEAKCNERFNKLKANEEELNRIFIDIYGLQDELTPEVDEKDVTVRKADLGRDIRSLISYAVGCMFGRYSLDCDGLAYAGGEWDASKYKTFEADRDNIIPICDDEYFDDDMTGRFVKWVETVYGKDTLEDNLKFIADALGGKGTPRDVIRSYFLNDFYADHLKNYQKRPIYWLFDSGKKNGFKALIYMHRYAPDTIARMRTDYVHEQQERYRTQIQMLEETVQSASASDRVKLSKQLAKLKEQALEIRQYEEKIHHLADQMISIDLDDGVKVNYAKFEDVLAIIK